MVQNRFAPIPVTNQVVFLYAAMNGFLDTVPVDMVHKYEIELYSFLKKTIFYLPFSYTLKTTLNETLMVYFLSFFSEYFVKYFTN